RWNGCNKESLRAYFPATERILFAEHYQGPYQPKHDGYAAKGRELKQHVMAPLISYFRDARDSLGVTSKQIAEATGKKNMASHWFGTSQWQLPNEGDYNKLQALFARAAAEKHQRGELEKPHHQLVSTYSELNRQYASLLEEYKSLRRYFSVSAAVPYTDVWMYKPVQYYLGKHPCEKPAEMLRQIITTSSRPGDLVADFFMGSGSTVKAAMALGRRAIGVELETGRFEQTVREVQDLVSQNG
ncbi:TPA: site-specific DNA-methyltransferase, partial [Escherichia coli]|nr:site-specific DNA-methyltransferase [Escherichia coli]